MLAMSGNDSVNGNTQQSPCALPQPNGVCPVLPQACAPVSHIVWGAVKTSFLIHAPARLPQVMRWLGHQVRQGWATAAKVGRWCYRGAMGCDTRRAGISKALLSAPFAGPPAPILSLQLPRRGLEAVRCTDTSGPSHYSHYGPECTSFPGKCCVLYKSTGGFPHEASTPVLPSLLHHAMAMQKAT